MGWLGCRGFYCLKEFIGCKMSVRHVEVENLAATMMMIRDVQIGRLRRSGALLGKSTPWGLGGTGLWEVLDHSVWGTNCRGDYSMETSGAYSILY